MEKPREFWASRSNRWMGDRDDIPSVAKYWSEQPAKYIEHRAYQKLQEENKKLREALEFYACGNHMRKETVRGRIIEYDVDAGPLHEVYEEYIHNEYPPGRTAQQALKEGEEA
jgi:hypothetical protein